MKIKYVKITKSSNLSKKSKYFARFYKIKELKEKQFYLFLIKPYMFLIKLYISFNF
jgi:hypothetical protein